MKELRKILLSYGIAVFGGAGWILYVVNKIDPMRVHLDIYWFVLSLVLVSVAVLPFMVLALVAYKKESRILQSISKGVAIWLFLFVLPLLIVWLPVTESNGQSGIFGLYLFPLVQVIISIYLVKHFSLPKSFVLPAILLPGIFNLYLLVYGIFRKTQN